MILTFPIIATILAFLTEVFRGIIGLYMAVIMNVLRPAQILPAIKTLWATSLAVKIGVALAIILPILIFLLLRRK